MVRKRSQPSAHAGRSFASDGHRAGRRRQTALAWITRAALALLAPAGAAAASAGCAATLLLSGGARPGDTIELVARPGLPKELLAKAVAVWESCPGYGLAFPAFVNEAPLSPAITPARRLTVDYHWQSDSSTCGRLRGNEIDVYAFAVDAEGYVQHCGSPALVLAHELGHVLGLADGSGEDGCGRHIMADIKGPTRYGRWVHDSECQVASRRWLTAAEQQMAAARAEGSP